LPTHTAGFPEDNPWGDRQLDDTDEELIQLRQEGLSFQCAGVACEYSNWALHRLATSSLKHQANNSNI